MNRTKKIILGLSATALLGTSLMAYSKHGKSDESCEYKKENRMMKKMSHHKRDGKVMMMLKGLDLSDAQKVEVRKIMQDNINNTPNPNNAFTVRTFDKDKYIRLSKLRMEHRLTAKAEIISKVYGILDPAQRKKLKEKIDSHDMMKTKHNKI